MFNNIAWATDGSENADRALEYAGQIARSEGAALHTVHIVEKLLGPRVAGQNMVVNEDEIDDKIKRQAGAVADESGINATLHMVGTTSQNVARNIAEVAEEAGADLVVVGTRGHSAIVGAILGSVTQRLLHLAPCPVLAVPPSKSTAAGAPAATETAITTG